MTHQQPRPADAEVIRGRRRAVAHLASLAFRRAKPFDVIADWGVPSWCEAFSHFYQGQAALDDARVTHLLCFCKVLGGPESDAGRKRFERLAAEGDAIPVVRTGVLPRALSRDMWPAIGSGCPRVGKALEKSLLAPNGWVSRGSFWVLDKTTSLVVYSRDWGTYRSHLDTRMSFPCLHLDSFPFECSKFFAIDAESFLSYSTPDDFAERYEKFLRLLIILGNEVRRVTHDAPD